MALLDVERSSDAIFYPTPENDIQYSLPRPKLSARLSASLDVARGIAACYVVLHHIAHARGWSNGVGVVLRFGQEAVLIFFY